MPCLLMKEAARILLTCQSFQAEVWVGSERTSLIVTSIFEPTAIMRCLALGSKTHGWSFILIGDSKSPPGFVLDGCDYYDIRRQLTLGLQFARAAPLNHYARKNIGYLVAARSGAEVIVETDDDNSPLEGFWLSAPGHSGYGSAAMKAGSMPIGTFRIATSGPKAFSSILFSSRYRHGRL